MTRRLWAIAAAFAASCGPPAADYAATGFMMGTAVTARAVAGDDATARRAAEAALAAAHEADRLAAYEDEDSELSRLNRAARGGAVRVSADLRQIIGVARRVAVATDGYFDPTIAPVIDLYGIKAGAARWPGDDEVAAAGDAVGYEGVTVDAAAGTVAFARPGMALDLSGVAKGWAADRAAAAMRAAGARAGIVEAGGEVACFGGGPAPGEKWRVGIKNPRRDGLYATFELGAGACATSGDYEQRFAAAGHTFSHLFDPHTGRPAVYAASVTVVAPTCAEADAWATALMVMPPERVGAVMTAPGAPAALVLRARGTGLTREVYGPFPSLRAAGEG